MIQAVVLRMYSETEENRFLEVTYANGDKEVLYFKDFNSGAMIQNIVDRARRWRSRSSSTTGRKGLRLQHLLDACVDEFRENEDLPNTTNPDDWARISGKKGERIVYIRTLVSGGKGPSPAGRSTRSATPASTCRTSPRAPDPHRGPAPSRHTPPPAVPGRTPPRRRPAPRPAVPSARRAIVADRRTDVQAAGPTPGPPSDASPRRVTARPPPLAGGHRHSRGPTAGPVTRGRPPSLRAVRGPTVTRGRPPSLAGGHRHSRTGAVARGRPRVTRGRAPSLAGGAGRHSRPRAAVTSRAGAVTRAARPPWAPSPRVPTT